VKRSRVVAHRPASRPVSRRIHGRASRASVFAPVFEAARSLIHWHKIFFPEEFKKRKKQDDFPRRTWEDFNIDLERIYGDEARRASASAASANEPDTVASGVPPDVEGARPAARNASRNVGQEVASA